MEIVGVVHGNVYGIVGWSTALFRVNIHYRPASVVCIEVKMAERWNRKWERAMRDLQSLPGIRVERIVGVYTGSRALHYDGLDVLPVKQFLQKLYNEEIF